MLHCVKACHTEHGVMRIDDLEGRRIQPHAVLFSQPDCALERRDASETLTFSNPIEDSFFCKRAKDWTE